MNNLFWANIIRLWKSRLTGLGIAVFSGLALVLCIDHYYYFREDMILDGIFFGYVYIAGIPVSVLAGLFLGVEYGDGTIRNKLIAGHKRSTVYLANFFAVFAASLILPEHTHHGKKSRDRTESQHTFKQHENNYLPV